MDWLPFLQKNHKVLSSTEEDCDPQACYDSFKEHWQQALKILHRVQQLPGHDDVLGVVNHLEQMGKLLLYDIKKNDNICLTVSNSKCLEYLLRENILDKLFQWSVLAGKYSNAVKCEEFKLYEMLITQSRHVLLHHDMFLKPMIKLLSSCQGQMFSREIEKLLVDLLNQLSALLMQHIEFIDLFFEEHKTAHTFIIFSLLLPFVHRDDSIGMRARDALQLCMSLSKKNKSVAIYIAEHSNFSILVASGLSGLYSALPNMIDDIIVPDWHRFTPDDVKEIKGLLMFVTSLEFSNAVAQLAHPIIRKQLQEFVYRGFLIPVLGPALLQANLQEQVSATAYFELILRTVTEPGLLHSLLAFLLKVEYDGERLLNILIQRINADAQLCLVSLAVFETLVEMNCEDLMLELVFKYLQPCLHLMLSQRRMLLPLDPYCQSFEKLLTLAPNCCDILDDVPVDGQTQWNRFRYKQSLYGKYYAYLSDARSKIGRCQMSCMLWSNSYTGADEIHTPTPEDNSNHLLSLETSSGYESFVTNFEDSKAFWEISSSGRSDSSRKQINIMINEEDQLTSSANAGPFLTILLDKLRNFLSNSVYINLHLTGLISRLAAYSQPLLRAYLLDHSLVLQPNVPSIFEIIGLLKQKIDEYLNRQPDRIALIKYARECLIDREIMLVNLRRYHAEQQKVELPVNNEPFQRNGPKRRSLNLPSSFTSIFQRRPSQIENSVPLVPTQEDVQFNLIYPKFNEGQHVALCAVVLDEWVKELGALAQEHTIAQLATLLK